MLRCPRCSERDDEGMWRKTYRPWEPERSRQDAQRPAAKLPEGDVVFFRLDPVPQLALSRFDATIRANPGVPHLCSCPDGLPIALCLLCGGIFESEIALARERHRAFVAIVGQDRPDFRTISDLRKLHLEACKDVLVQVVRRAAETGLGKLGNVSTDGTKIQGNASRHKAMSYGSMKKAAERGGGHCSLGDAGAPAGRGGLGRPGQPTRRRTACRIGAPRGSLGADRGRDRRVEAPAKAEADAERQRRGAADAARQRTGQKRRGKAPPPVEDTPDDKAQSNCTEPELHIMRTNNKGGDYCGKAQASVDGACQSIVACDVTDASNDKQQAEPVAQATLATWLKRVLSAPRTRLAPPRAIPATRDNGSDSEAAVAARATFGVEPYIATGRQGHHAPQAEAPRSPPRRRSAWRRNCGRQQGRRCTPDARSSWSRCLARSKKHVGSVGSGRAVCRKFVANGVWSA